MTLRRWLYLHLLRRTPPEEREIPIRVENPDMKEHSQWEKDLSERKKRAQRLERKATSVTREIERLRKMS